MLFVSIVIGGWLVLTAGSACGQSAFLDKGQSGFGLLGGYSKFKGVSTYTVDFGVSTEGKSDAGVSLGLSRYFNSNAYSLGLGYTHYLAIDNSHEAPALGGVPIGIVIIDPPGSSEVTVAGSIGLSVDLPAYATYNSRLVLSGGFDYTYQLAPETNDRDRVFFVVGAAEGIRMSTVSTLVLGLFGSHERDTRDWIFTFQMGIVLAD
jgi:hypothetical protein